MSDAPLTRERILEAAEEVLRRYGPSKATVVDVARALAVSHGSVYRHFPSKAALRDAVTALWLARMAEPLHAIAERDEPAPQRLRRWLDGLVATKRSQAIRDPELFATYTALAAEARTVVLAHVDELVGQLAAIVADGMAAGDFAPGEPAVAARAVFDATGRFHNPAHAAAWGEPGIDEAFEGVWALVLAGLRAGRAEEPDTAAAPSRAGRDEGPDAAAAPSRAGRADGPGTAATPSRPDHGARSGAVHPSLASRPRRTHRYGRTMAEPCSHLDTVQHLEGREGVAGCPECLASGSSWVHLRRCTQCGQVGCCDSSPNRHATAHHHATGHPVIRSLEPGEDWLYCYDDDVAFLIRR